MNWYSYKPYMSIADRRRDAADKLAKLRAKGGNVAPVEIEGRTITRSFWGTAWCKNLEHYSDFASRLPRGRSYVRNGFVIDLHVARGAVTAQVVGSSVYTVKIAVAPVAAARWRLICRDCAGSIASLIELLQGKFDTSVMERVCRPGDGLFPAPGEIKLSCTCPDWADMCKHVAAALYGVGARLDHEPQQLFKLRGVDEADLLADVGGDMALVRLKPRAGKALDPTTAAALFGLDIAAPDAGAPNTPTPDRASDSAPKAPRKTRLKKRRKRHKR